MREPTEDGSELQRPFFTYMYVGVEAAWYAWLEVEKRRFWEK